jgi:hypothetical protein
MAVGRLYAQIVGNGYFMYMSAVHFERDGGASMKIVRFWGLGPRV